MNNEIGASDVKQGKEFGGKERVKLGKNDRMQLEREREREREIIGSVKLKQNEIGRGDEGISIFL